MQERIIETQKRGLGEEHPTTLRSMENLALKLASTETRYNYKKKLLRRKKSGLGAGHVNTLESMPILARCYHSAGQDEQATQFGEETFAA